jgi:hypothetical protein
VQRWRLQQSVQEVVAPDGRVRKPPHVQTRARADSEARAGTTPSSSVCPASARRPPGLHGDVLVASGTPPTRPGAPAAIPPLPRVPEPRKWRSARGRGQSETTTGSVDAGRLSYLRSRGRLIPLPASQPSPAGRGSQSVRRLSGPVIRNDPRSMPPGAYRQAALMVPSINSRSLTRS